MTTTAHLDERERLLAHRPARLEAAVEGLARAWADPDRVDRQGARQDLQRAIVETLGYAHLLGRRRVLLEVEQRRDFAAAAEAKGTDLLPAVPFPEAVASLAKRYPAIVLDLPPGLTLPQAVSAIVHDGGFTMARAAEVEIVDRVQKAIVEAMEAGTGHLDAVSVLESMGDWTRNYAATVYENAVSTAYTSGTFRQLGDPDVRRVIGALRFDSIPDTRRSEICTAFEGTLAEPEHDIWDQRSAPCHHRCRSNLSFVDWATLRREGHIRDGRVVPKIPNPNVRPQEGFGRRPAGAVWGAR